MGHNKQWRNLFGRETRCLDTCCNKISNTKGMDNTYLRSYLFVGNTYDQTGSCSDKALDSYSAGTRFKSRPD
jgi:hypothetical protein